MKNTIAYFAKSIVLISVILLSACSLDSECYSSFQVPVTTAVFPDSVKVDSTGEIVIGYLPLVPCSTFKEFQTYSSSDTISIVLWAEQAVCSCNTPADTMAVFTFSPKAKRDYIFRLYHFADSVIQDTIRGY